jgi:hypothetical protein
MRRTRCLMYPVALVVLIWAEFGIVRANLPVYTNTPAAPKGSLISASARPVPMSADLIADARTAQADR